MSMNLFQKSKLLRDDAGVALITSLLLLFLMSSLLVGFCILLISNQQLAGSNNDDVTAFYAAEAGMEQMTANLGDLFAQTYSPTSDQINNIQLNPPLLPNISYLTSNGTSGYTITPTAVDSKGNPAPTNSTIKSGNYAGMTAMLTEYTMYVNARTTAGREVKLQRTVQTVGIPLFQFGIFSDTDLSFFAGPDFQFGGRTHTNGNLFLAEGNGNTLTMSDKVDAYKDVIRTNLENGWPVTSNYTGTVNITTQPGGSTYRALAYSPSEGSLAGAIGSASRYKLVHDLYRQLPGRLQQQSDEWPGQRLPPVFHRRKTLESWESSRSVAAPRSPSTSSGVHSPAKPATSLASAILRKPA